MRISDWGSDVCSSDLHRAIGGAERVDLIVLADHIDAAERNRRRAAQRAGRLHFPDHRPVGGVECRDVADPARRIDDIAVDRGPAAEQRILEIRSEEHTSELQSLMRTSYAVFCLQKKKE